MAGDKQPGNFGNVGKGHPRGENGWPAGVPADEVFTPEGKARALANLKPDRLAATKHGLTTFLTRAIAPPCRFCIAKSECDRFREGNATCILAEEYQAEVTAQIMALPQIQPEDRPLVLEYAKTATALTIIDRYVAHASPLLPGSDKGYLDVQPVMKQRAGLSSQLVKLADALGLSPAARAKLKVGERDKQGGLAAALAEISRRQARQETAGAIDAEFSAQPPDEE